MNLLKLKFVLIFIIFTKNSYSQEVNLIEELIIKKDYYQADSLLKKIILNQKTVKSDITFLFGKNSYFINKYEQSINCALHYCALFALFYSKPK